MTRRNSRQRHSHHLLLAAALFVIFVACGGLLVQAQVESGKIVGTIKDASGALISGASVTVTETQTNASQQNLTDSQGEYVVTELKPGIYAVMAEREGFKTAVQTDFKLDINQVVRVDFTLVVGSHNEQVDSHRRRAASGIRNLVDRTGDR